RSDRHVDRALRDSDPWYRARWGARRQGSRPCLARDVPHGQYDVRRTARWCDRDHRRADVLPRYLARPDCRAAQSWKVLLMESGSMDNPEVSGATAATATLSPSSSPTAHGVAEARGLFDKEILVQALGGAFRKLDPRVQVK